MDHDSVPSDVAGPASSRIADVQATYATITEHALAELGELIESDDSFASNDEGHLAWDLSLLVRAACLTWQVTGEPAHLRQAVTWALRLCRTTDEARGAIDWRGRSGPVWSAGSRYCPGIATIGTISGKAIRLQASADHTTLERPSPSTAVVRLYRNDHVTWTSPEASLMPGDAKYLPDALSQYSASHMALIRGLDEPTDLSSLAVGRFPMQAQKAPHLVHTGMIARALIAAAEALDSAEPGTVAVDITPEELLTAADRALAFHDDEIRVRHGRSWYITPLDFPGRRLGLDLPHNHVVDAATSFLILARLRKESARRELAVSLIGRWLGELEEYSAQTLRHPWHYYPVDSDAFSGVEREHPMSERSVRAVPRAEDSSHATMRVRALVEWKSIDPTLVSDETMSTVALAFRRFYMTSRKGTATLKWLPDDPQDALRLGKSDTYPGAWGGLAPWDSTIKRRLNAMARHHPPESFFGATVLSSAEILAMNAKVATYASSRRTARE